MNHSINSRFWVAAALISAGCAIMLAGESQGLILFGLSGVLSMPRSELREPISRSQFWGIAGGLIALVAVSAASKYFLPISAADVFHRFICHPVFVLPFWLFMMSSLFRNYQRQKVGIDV